MFGTWNVYLHSKNNFNLVNEQFTILGLIFERIIYCTSFFLYKKKKNSLTNLDICNKNDIRPFSLSGKKVSKFFVANYLWDMMEEDW